MKYPLFKHLAAVTTVLAVVGSHAPASAQYVWLDEKGTRQYSDMPPPSSVPTKRILKQAGKPVQTTSTSPAPSEEKPAVAAQMNLAEKNAEFKKRQAEQAEKEKKTAEEARLAAEKAKNCERAGEYQRILESGERVTRTDKNGERSFLTDEQRIQEIRDAKRVVEGCKS